MAELIAGQRAAAAADLETAVSVARVRLAQAKQEHKDACSELYDAQTTVDGTAAELHAAKCELKDLLAQRDRELADAVARDAEGAGL